MRGNSLADPTVVGLLQPFILSYGYGHRDDDPPAEWKELFPSRRIDNGAASNVRALVLDARGKAVHAFDAMAMGEPGPMHETQPRHFARQIRAARKLLGIGASSAAPRELRLPDAQEGERAVRIFVRLDDPGMPAYNAPVVEVAAPGAEAWKALEWPAEARKVDASLLQACFRHVYPPGVMERQDKTTMVHYKIARAEGELTLEAAGADGATRFALLRGKVRLTDEGPDEFSYSGKLSIVLAYGDGPQPTSLRGVFEGNYRRYDLRNDWERKMPLTAVFESLPAARE